MALLKFDFEKYSEESEDFGEDVIRSDRSNHPAIRRTPRSASSARIREESDRGTTRDGSVEEQDVDSANRRDDEETHSEYSRRASTRSATRSRSRSRSRSPQPARRQQRSRSASRSRSPPPRSRTPPRSRSRSRTPRSPPRSRSPSPSRRATPPLSSSPRTSTDRSSPARRPSPSRSRSPSPLRRGPSARSPVRRAVHADRPVDPATRRHSNQPRRDEAVSPHSKSERPLAAAAEWPRPPRLAANPSPASARRPRSASAPKMRPSTAAVATPGRPSGGPNGQPISAAVAPATANLAEQIYVTPVARRGITISGNIRTGSPPSRRDASPAVRGGFHDYEHLRDENLQLKQQLNQSEDANGKLVAQVRRLAKLLSEKDRQIGELLENKALVNSPVSARFDALRRETALIGGLKRRIRELEGEVERQRAALAELKGSSRHLRIAELETELQTYITEAQRLKAVVAQQAEQLAATASKKSAYKAKVRLLQELNMRYRKSRRGLKERVRALEEDYAVLERDHKRLQTGEQQRDGTRRLADEVARLRDECDVIRERHRRAADEADGLRRTVASLNDELARVRTELASLKTSASRTTQRGDTPTAPNVPQRYANGATSESEGETITPRSQSQRAPNHSAKPTDKDDVDNEEVDNEKREHAAVIIQKTWRGFAARQAVKAANAAAECGADKSSEKSRYSLTVSSQSEEEIGEGEEEEKEEEKDEEEDDEEAIAGHRSVSMETAERERRQQAATKIQSAWRGHVAREKIRSQQTAAVKIQSQYRGFRARKQFHEKYSRKQTSPEPLADDAHNTNREQAAVKIQALYRGFCERKKFKAMHEQMEAVAASGVDKQLAIARDDEDDLDVVEGEEEYDMT